jgi:hypothetical protein
MKVKLNPQTRKHGAIHCKKNDSNFVKGQIYFCFLNSPTKNYSFLVKITEIIQDQFFGPHPELEVDKYLTGNLVKDDIVDIIPYNLTHAEKITFGISDSYIGITPGDWTASIKDLLQDTIVDLGTNIKVALPMGDKIMILRGQALESYPQLPTEIGPTTQILIKKFNELELKEKKDEFEEKKISRTNDLRKIVVEKILSKIRTENLELVTEKLDFSLQFSASLIFDESVAKIFSHYDLVDEEISEKQKKIYTANRTYFIYNQGVPEEIMEYQFTSSKKHGTLILRIFNPNKDVALAHAKEFKEYIREIHNGFKQKQGSKDIISQVQYFVLLKGTEIESDQKIQLPLSTIYRELLSTYPDLNLTLKKLIKIMKNMVKNGVIADLQKLPTGYYLIVFHPPELTKDPTTLIQLSEKVEYLTKEEIMIKLGWTENRTVKALDFLLEKKMVRVDKSYLRGERFYFVFQ